jgi:hypothetical protein
VLHSHNEHVKITRRGTWLYDGTATMPVDMVGLPYDFWYEVDKADDQLEPGEVPMALGVCGLLYYVRFHDAGKKAKRTWPDSIGHATVEEAMRTAQARVPSPIKWAWRLST